MTAVAVSPGYKDRKDDLLRRLRRVEGQVRGLERLIEDETYCIDVLTQVAATTKALQAVAVQLLQDHLRRCVAGAMICCEHESGGECDSLTVPRRDPDDVIAEATLAIERLLRT
ncbi:MAG: metal-sensitive transcriptional regulator [Acidimicrobiales bacterium]